MSCEDALPQPQPASVGTEHGQCYSHRSAKCINRVQYGVTHLGSSGGHILKCGVVSCVVPDIKARHHSRVEAIQVSSQATPVKDGLQDSRGQQADAHLAAAPAGHRDHVLLSRLLESLHMRGLPQCRCGGRLLQSHYMQERKARL